jgi:hypothetical protein
MGLFHRNLPHFSEVRRKKAKVRHGLNLFIQPLTLPLLPTAIPLTVARLPLPSAPLKPTQLNLYLASQKWLR